jgi:hypothetical protein
MVLYRESLTPSLPFHLALALVIPLGFGMLAPINIGWGIASAIGFYALAMLSFVVFAPKIVVTATELRVGRARIERRFVGDAFVIPADARSATIADARTWKLIRGWIPRGVLVTIVDPSDPTPNWYCSSRHPERLVAALAN